MSDAEDILAAAVEVAQGPKSVAKDGESLQQHSIADLLAAANIAADESSRTRPGFGLRVQKIKPVYD